MAHFASIFPKNCKGAFIFTSISFIQPVWSFSNSISFSAFQRMHIERQPLSLSKQMPTRPWTLRGVKHFKSFSHTHGIYVCAIHLSRTAFQLNRDIIKTIKCTWTMMHNWNFCSFIQTRNLVHFLVLISVRFTHRRRILQKDSKRLKFIAYCTQMNWFYSRFHFVHVIFYNSITY